MATYNTGGIGTLAAASHTTAFTFTIPAGVASGDVMIVSIETFGYPGMTSSFGAPSSGGGSWAQIGTPQFATQTGGSNFATFGTCWWRVATASDPGSTFSLSYTGAAGSTDQVWWSATIDAYTGFYTTAPIGNFTVTGAANTPIAPPATTTSAANSWAYYSFPVSCNSGGSVTAEPTTSRHNANVSGIACSSSDSAGSAGAAGSTIGGSGPGSWNTSAGTGASGSAFTVELRTQAPPNTVIGVTPPQIAHPIWYQLLDHAASRADWQAQGVASLQQQHWRLMDGANGRPGIGSSGTQPPATGTSNGATAIVNGLAFYVSQGGQWFEGYWYYCCASGQSTAPTKFALWSVVPNSYATSSVVPGSVVTSGTLTAGAWNWVPLAQPVQLAVWGNYEAAVGVAASAGYPDTGSQFGSGQPYSAGITNGPLTAFSQTGGSNPAFGASNYQCLTSIGSDPSQVRPGTSVGASDNIWLDVQVTNTPPAGYAGSYRLWPNNTDADTRVTADSSVNYVIGTEVILSQSCYVNKIWYYIPAGTAQFATSADIWNVRTGVRVATQGNPVWRQISGAPATSTTGQGGGSQQWVWCDLPGPTYLGAGDYYVTVYNGNGSPDGWGAKQLGYWEAYNQAPDGTYQHTPPGQNGITSGPLYAPPTPLASTIQDYTNPAVLEPGQSVFAVGPPNQFPNRYVGNGPGQTVAVFQNYWIDLEVTPTSTWAPDQATPPQIPHPLFNQIRELAMRQMLPDSGTEPQITYNTSAAATSAGSQVASQNITIPAGVRTGDVVLVLAEAVNVTNSTVPTLTASSTGTLPVQIGSTTGGTEPLPASIAGAMYYFVASATDAGKVITISTSINSFMGLALAAYTGASDINPIDVSGGAYGGADTLSVTCPVRTIGVTGEWAIYLGGGAAEGSAGGAMSIPAGSTARQNTVDISAIGVAITDSNGSVGAAGASIGGGTFTCGTSVNSMLTGFTIGLVPAGGVPPASAGVTGVPATLTLAAPGGSVSAGVTITGSTAGLALAAPAGSVSTSAGVTGLPAGLTLVAPAGSVSAGATITGLAAQLALGAPAGSVSAGATIAGQAAQLALGAPGGSVSAGATVAGAVAQLALGAPVGTVTTGGGLVGTPAVLTLSAPPGSVSAGATIAGTVAVLNLGAPPGSDGQPSGASSQMLLVFWP